MALLVLTSAAGSPGVTTLALGLALTWPRSVILVDADPGAHQAVLAGFLGGRVRTGKGLQRVAEAHRDRRPLREVVSDQTIDLSDDATTARRLLPGFVRPANAALFGPVWPDLADTFSRLDLTGIDVIVDAGRIGPTGLPQPLVERADLCALLVRSSLRALAAARAAAGTLAEQGRLSGGSDNVGAIVVGPDRPYGRREIAKLLNLPALTAVPDDPASASSLVDGARRARRFDSAPLPKALPHVIDDLQVVIRQRRERLAGLGARGPRPEDLGGAGSTVPGERTLPLPSAPASSAASSPPPASTASAGVRSGAER